jgi:hypothetical protein
MDDMFDLVPSEDLGRALLAGRWIGIAMGTIVVEVQMEWAPRGSNPEPAETRSTTCAGF